MIFLNLLIGKKINFRTFIFNTFLLLPVMNLSAQKFEMTNIPVETKKLISVVGEEDNGIFFTLPFYISYNKYENKVYAADIKQNEIYIFDPDLKILNKFGRSGQGPVEFNEPSVLNFDELNNIYIFDVNNLRVQILDKNKEYISGFTVKPGGITSGMQINSKQEIILSQTDNECLLTVFDKKGTILHKFGDLIYNIDPLTKRIFDGQPEGFKKMLFKISFAIDEDDNIYCGLEEFAIFRKYDRNFNLIYEKDFNRFPDVSKGFKDWQDLTNGKTRESHRSSIAAGSFRYSFKQLLGRVKVDKNYVYVSFDFTENQNTVYALNKNTGDIVKKILFEPGDKDFHIYDFDLSHDNYIYAVDSWWNAVLLKYKK